MANTTSGSPMFHQGTYYIVNRMLSPSGQKLALTFNGENNTVTVTPLINAHNQAWAIRDHTDGKTQSVSPVSSPRLQIGMGSGVIKVLSPGGYVWTLRNTPSGATIQDGGVTVFWGLAEAQVDQPVAFGKEAANVHQRWVMIPA
ncbi:CCL2-like lectin domain-containing protein [Pleurotus pulmonarius]